MEEMNHNMTQGKPFGEQTQKLQELTLKALIPMLWEKFAPAEWKASEKRKQEFEKQVLKALAEKADGPESPGFTDALNKITISMIWNDVAPEKLRGNEVLARKFEELTLRSQKEKWSDERGDQEIRKLGGDEMLARMKAWKARSAIKPVVDKEWAKKHAEEREAKSRKFMETQRRVQRGLMFFNQLLPDADAHYAGKGVSLGASDTPIFWYSPKHSQNYRVIYADLSVRNAGTPPRVESVSGTARSKPAAKPPFEAHLPSGVTVELLGISENPSRDRPWWRPDGSPLPERPYDWLGASIADEKGKIPREIAVRLRNLPAGTVGEKWQFDPPCDTSSASPPGLDRSPKGIGGVALLAPVASRTITVRFGLAAGPWQTITDCKAALASPDAVFAPPVEKDGSAMLSVAHRFADRDARIVAVDFDGQAHVAAQTQSGGGGKLYQITSTFLKMPLNNVKTFRFQTRQYQWVEFRNVSLYPGEKTDVQAVVPAAGSPIAQSHTASMSQAPTASASLSAESPQLRFLAWQDEYSKTEPRGAIHPDGSPADNPSELQTLAFLRPVPCDASRTEEDHRNPRFLHLWFSHPLFEKQSFKDVTFLDEAGRPIPLNANGMIAAHPYGLMQIVVHGRGEPLGWLTCTASPKTDSRAVTVRLRYMVGPLERTSEIEVKPNSSDVVALEGGSQLGSIGQNLDGKAFVGIAVNSSGVKDRSFAVVAVTRNHSELIPLGVSIGGNQEVGARKEEFTFDAPLSDIARFRIGTRPIRTIEFHNVALSPGQKTDVQAVVPVEEKKSPETQKVSGTVSESKDRFAPTNPLEDSGTLDVDTAHWTVPKSWVRKTPKSTLLQAEYAIPKSEGDKADGRLTVSQSHGPLDANIARWEGQFATKVEQGTKGNP